MRIQCIPTAGVIESMRQRKVGLPNAASELIDNAFDKGARNIRVDVSDDQVEILDDGSGVIDLPAMMTLGRHEGNGGTIGRYGVGFKDAVVWLGRELEVETVHSGYRRSCFVDWEIAQKSAWDFDFSELEPTSLNSFTRIRVSGIYRNRVRQKKELGNSLAHRFTPGILSGARICLNGEDLIPLPLPDLSDMVVLDELFDGLHFRLTVGILVNPQEERYGYDVAYKHRLIRENDDEGAFGTYSNQRIYGYLELLDDGEASWMLSAHKTDFEERPDLYDYLFDQIEALLQKADTIGQQIEFRELEGELSIELADAIGKLIREKRGRQGTQAPGDPQPPGASAAMRGARIEKSAGQSRTA